MAQTLRVKLIGMDAEAMPEESLRSFYAADLHFDPIRRRSEIAQDGTVEIKVSAGPSALYAWIAVPDFGELWVGADNCGEGYRAGAGPIDFVREAAASRLAEVRRCIDEAETAWSVDCRAHVDAAAECLAEAGDASDVRAARLRLLSLSHGLWAGELAVVEHARAQIAARPKREEFLFGSTAFGRFSGREPAEAVQRRFTELFNLGVLPFYLKALEPQEGQPDYSRVDEMLGWCEREGIATKGHPLWWGLQAGIPAWLEGADWARVQRQCRRVVHRSVERYRDRIMIWDAINEAHDWANGLALTQEQEVEITRVACDSIRDKDPAATAIVNHCQVDGAYAADERIRAGSMRVGPIYDRVLTPLSYLDRLMEADVDFDVVGLQMYFPSNIGRDMMTISKYLDEYARFGKPMHITELGLPSGKRDMPDDLKGDQLARVRGQWHQPWCERVQADWTEWFYTLCYARPDIEAITWWSLSDPAFIPGGGWLRSDGTPKESYHRVRALLRDWGHAR
jgi:GH35 family endo-1,4-beta-xylanase